MATDSLVDALREEIRAAVRDELQAMRGDGDEWIDQAHSPLGRRTHCMLVRTGELPGVRLHRRVLVRRRDLDAYIESHRSAPAVSDSSAGSEAKALARVGARRVA
jgi:excisionase family DNA binding protein